MLDTKHYNMTISFKNLSVNFTDTEADFSGMPYLTVPQEYVKQFFEDTEGCEYGVDDVDNYNEDCKGEDFNCTNTDFQIIFMNWAFDQDKTISFSYEGDNLFWLYHDFHHAMNDVTGTEIYVNGHIEAERHYQAIQLMVERNEIGLIDIAFLQNHVKDFQERSEWSNNFNADDFDLQHAIELAGFDTEEIRCQYCDHESEPTELSEEEREELDDQEHTHKCDECEETGERYMFYQDLTELMY